MYLFKILNNLRILFILYFYLSKTLNNLDLYLFSIFNNLEILFV